MKPSFTTKCPACDVHARAGALCVRSIDAYIAKDLRLDTTSTPMMNRAMQFLVAVAPGAESYATMHQALAVVCIALDLKPHAISSAPIATVGIKRVRDAVDMVGRAIDAVDKSAEWPALPARVRSMLTTASRSEHDCEHSRPVPNEAKAVLGAAGGFLGELHGMATVV